MKKILVGIVLGGALFAAVGFTYDVTRAAMTEMIVDARIVELGGHEYVIASSCSPCRSYPKTELYSYPKVSTMMTANVNLASGGSSIAIIHHVGCKACNK